MHLSEWRHPRPPIWVGLMLSPADLDFMLNPVKCRARICRLDTPNPHLGEGRWILSSGWIIDYATAEPKDSWGKRVPVSLSPPQIPRGLRWQRILSSALRRQNACEICTVFCDLDEIHKQQQCESDKSHSFSPYFLRYLTQCPQTRRLVQSTRSIALSNVATR
jgi:hypothetical protein